MSRKKNFRTYTVALTAGQELNLGIDGNMYAVIDNVGEFTIVLDESNRLNKQTSGMGGQFIDTYERVTMLSTTTQTVTVIFGYGAFEDARASVNATLNVTVGPSDTLDNTGDVTVTSAATLIKAADINTREVLVHVPSEAAAAIRIGGSGVTATSGIRTEAGMSRVFNSEAALYAISEGADVDVSTLKLSRP